MSVTFGVFRVHHLIEKIIPAPYAVNLQTHRLTQSASYNHCVHKLIRTKIWVTIAFPLLPFIIWRLVWLIFYWKTFTSLHFDHLICYAALIGAIFIFIAAWHLENTKSQKIQFILNQRCNLISITSYSSTSQYNMEIWFPYSGIISFKELFIYGFSFPGFLANFGVIDAPFAITYDPIELYFGEQGILLNLLFGFIYFSLILYGQTV